MDGEITPVTVPDIAPAARAPYATPTRAKRTRWFVIVALLLALVLGGLYGFNAYRSKAIATFFHQQQAAAGADQRGGRDQRGGAALRPRGRFADGGASGHGDA